MKIFAIFVIVSYYLYILCMLFIILYTDFRFLDSERTEECIVFTIILIISFIMLTKFLKSARFLRIVTFVLAN